LGRVVNIDAADCAYYVKGRCRRPTSSRALESWRCRLLLERRRLSRSTMSDLARLGRFQVDSSNRAMEKARQRIVEKTFVQMRRVVCPDRIPPQGPGQICGRQDSINCLLLMPWCQGRCENYFVGGRALQLAQAERDDPKA
jgi:hypothetical protein